MQSFWGRIKPKPTNGKKTPQNRRGRYNGEAMEMLGVQPMVEMELKNETFIVKECPEFDEFYTGHNMVKA